MKITANVFLGTGQDLRERVHGAYAPRHSEMITVLEDFQHMALRRKDESWSHAQLQTWLASSLVAELRFVQQIKDGSLTTRDERSDHFLKQLSSVAINAMMQIADGMAFRFLNYNQGLCHAFAGNETTPYSATQEGFLNAVEVAAVMNDSIGPDTQILICDLNGITNVGDVIIKHQDAFEVLEVKQGKKTRGSRLQRQKARLDALTRLINDGRGVLHDREVQMIEQPSRKTYMKELAAALAVADAEGFSVQQLTGYMSLACIDLKGTQRTDDKDVLEQMDAETKKLWKGERTVEISSLITRQWAECVPLTAFPSDCKTIIELLMGFKVFNVTISFDALRATFERAGWDVADLTESDLANQPFPEPLLFWLLEPGNPNRNIGFSVGQFTQTAANLLDVEDFLRFAKQAVSTRPELTHWVPSYPDESSIWI